MKKVSTAAGKGKKSFQGQQLTIGLDLGDRSSWYCVPLHRVPRIVVGIERNRPWIVLFL
jgi:hypothetical protein